MNQDEHLKRIQERIRAAQTGGAERDAQLPDDSDELFSALEEGTETFDGADEETLGRTLERFGTRRVSEAIAAGSRARSSAAGPSSVTPGPGEESTGGQILGGAHWFQRPLMAAAAAVLIGGFLYFQFGRGGTGPLVQDVQVAWLELSTDAAFGSGGTWEDSPRLVLEGGEPDWNGSSRGAGDELPADLRRRTVVITTDRAFGAGVLLDGSGLILTSSALVAGVVQEAAWTAAVPRLQVELVGIDDEGDASQAGAPLTSVVLRHRPDLGLSLLSLDLVAAGGSWGDLEPLRIMEGPLAQGQDVSLSAASADGVALTLPSESSAPTSHAELLWDEEFEWRGVGPETVHALEDVRYRVGSLGSPAFTEAPSGERGLAGIVVGGTGEGTWITTPAAVREILASVPPEPEPYPFDPWFLPSEGARTASLSNASGALSSPALFVRSEDQNGQGMSAVFASSTPQPEGASFPIGLPGSPSKGDYRFDLVVILADGGRIVLGTTDESGTLNRIWTGQAKDAITESAFTRNPDGSWTITPPNGRALGSADWLPGTTRDLLDAVGKALAR